MNHGLTVNIKRPALRFEPGAQEPPLEADLVGVGVDVADDSDVATHDAADFARRKSAHWPICNTR